MKKNEKIKIAFICHYSNPELRNRIGYKDRKIENLFRKMLGHKELKYVDFAPWVPLLLKGFENNPNYELHVIAPFGGLKKKKEIFTDKGLIFHIIRSASGELVRYLLMVIKKYRDNPDIPNYKLIQQELKNIEPDVICLCGAENLDYSPSILGINKKPILVLLQTLLNKSSYVNMGVSEEKRKCERHVLTNVQYIAGKSLYYDILKNINPNAELLRCDFPIKNQLKLECQKTSTDFIFFSMRLTKNKGIEDTIDAFAKVCSVYPNATLDIIGGYNSDYKQLLDNKISDYNLQKNIHFLGFFEDHSSIFYYIAKSLNIVLPGITAVFNSTVGEGMFMKKPVITYKSCNDLCFKDNGKFLLFSEIGNIDDLGKQMLYAYEHPDEMKEMAERAYLYAQKYLSAESRSKQLMDNIDAVYEHYYNHKRIPEELLLVPDKL